MAKGLSFNELRQAYHNESVSDAVENNNDPDKIVEGKYRMIQKVYPVYKRPNPSVLLDIRTHFFAPEKHFAGKFFDTCGLMWSLSG